MDTLFSLIFVVSIVCFVAGLIKPSWFSFLSKKEVTRVRTSLVFVLIGFTSIIGGIVVSEPSTSQTTNNRQQNQAKNTKSTQDKLWTALDRSKNTRKNFDIKWGSDNGLVTIIKKDGDYWDENDTVRTSYDILVSYGKETFKINEVKQIKVVVKGKFTDQYGKNSDEDAVRIQMEKSEFEKFNWDNLEGAVIYDQIKKVAEEHYLHPAIRKGISKQKLYLST